jgi:hypothetical protein
MDSHHIVILRAISGFASKLKPKWNRIRINSERRIRMHNKLKAGSNPEVHKGALNLPWRNGGSISIRIKVKSHFQIRIDVTSRTRVKTIRFQNHCLKGQVDCRYTSPLKATHLSKETTGAGRVGRPGTTRLWLLPTHCAAAHFFTAIFSIFL